jgi:hypothetical protein
MPNAIKYSTGSETNALKKGNFYIGTGSEGKGPSDVTGYYNGVTPQTGGYVIYMFKDGAPGNLSYHSAANNSELISFTSGLAGQTYTGVSQCFDYYAGQTDKVMIIQEFPSDYPLNYPNIVMPGLILNLDAGITQSYPGSGTTWTDINGLGPNNNGTLTNGPTFNTDGGGSIVFDGVDDYVDFGNTSTLNNITIQMFVNVTSNSGRYRAFAAAKGTNQDYDTGFNIDMQFPSRSSFDRCSIEGGFLRIPLGTNFMTSSVSFGTWCNICFTVSPTYIQFYLNGSAQYGTSRLNNASSTIGMNSLSIGRRPIVDSAVTSFIDAKISTTQIYNRALSATEVLQNYNAQKGRFGL